MSNRSIVHVLAAMRSTFKEVDYATFEKVKRDFEAVEEIYDPDKYVKLYRNDCCGKCVVAAQIELPEGMIYCVRWDL